MLTCQRGSESVIKADLLQLGWRLAFSRPGFVTLKTEAGQAVSPSNLPVHPFVRCSARSIGQSKNASLEALLHQLRSRLGAETEPASGAGEPWQQLHVWARDRAIVGEFGFEPHSWNPLVSDLAKRIGENLRQEGLLDNTAPNQVASRGQRVLDIVLVEPGHWWFGDHVSNQALPSRWPGGVQPMDAEKPVVSRAYFKLAEALAWSQFPLQPGDTVVEVGSAPGGACQRLLEMGFQVIGIDPGDMDADVLAHRNMRHVRGRAEALPRSLYRDATWLVVDANIKPARTLWTVGQIVNHRLSRLQGLLLTLKLGAYDQAEKIPQWAEQVRDWGFTDVQVRQLATGRCEVCLAARRPI